MAEVAVDERRLLKTIRWWDGFVIGLANPGFLLIALWGSIIALGGKWATVLFVISAIIGALQAYIYCEPAAMFPDKPGGLSVYAREGWRKHFSFAGPSVPSTRKRYHVFACKPASGRFAGSGPSPSQPSFHGCGM